VSVVIRAGEVVKGTETGRQHGNEAREKDLVGKPEPVTMEEVVESTVSIETLVSANTDRAMRRHPGHRLLHLRVLGQQTIRRPGSTLQSRTATARSIARRYQHRHREKRYQSARRRVQTPVHEKAAKAEEKAEKVVRVVRRRRRLLGPQIGQRHSSEPQLPRHLRLIPNSQQCLHGLLPDQIFL